VSSVTEHKFNSTNCTICGKVDFIIKHL